MCPSLDSFILPRFVHLVNDLFKPHTSFRIPPSSPPTTRHANFIVEGRETHADPLGTNPWYSEEIGHWPNRSGRLGPGIHLCSLILKISEVLEHPWHLFIPYDPIHDPVHPPTMMIESVDPSSD